MAARSLCGAKMMQELAFTAKVELYNFRTYHTYIDEDTIGTLKGLCRKVHKRCLELRVCLRWLLRLRVHKLHNREG